MGNKVKRSAVFIVAVCVFAWGSLLGNESPCDKKVALLFLTVADLNHSDLWEKAITDHQELYNVYVHSKYKMDHPFFAQFRIKQSVPNSWSAHVKAWQLLLREALKDQRNYKFVFLSNSCVPLWPLDVIYQSLVQDDITYMRFLRPWWKPHNHREVTELPEKYRWANHEWVVLNRKHATMIVQDIHVIEVVARHSHDQESYPSTLFSVHNCLHEVNNRMLTYVNFYVSGDPRHPYTFREANDFDIWLMTKVKKYGYLFVRKVAPEFPESVLIQVMETN